MSAQPMSGVGMVVGVYKMSDGQTRIDFQGRPNGPILTDLCEMRVEPGDFIRHRDGSIRCAVQGWEIPEARDVWRSKGAR